MAGDTPDNEHPYSTDHEDYDQASELAKSGMTSGTDAYSHGLNEDDDPEVQLKKQQDQLYFNVMMSKMTADAISSWTERNAQLAEEINDLYKQWFSVQERYETTSVQLTVLQNDLNDLDKIRAALRVKVEQAETDLNSSYQKLEQSGNEFYDTKMPATLVHIRHYDNPNACTPADMEVAVTQKNGQFYYLDPRTKTEVLVTNEGEISSIKEQIANGKKTTDQTTTEEQDALRQYYLAGGKYLENLQLNSDAYDRLWKAKQEAEQAEKAYQAKLAEVKDCEQKLADIKTERDKIESGIHSRAEEIALNNRSIELSKTYSSEEARRIAEQELKEGRLAELKRQEIELMRQRGMANAVIAEKYTPERFAQLEKGIEEAQQAFDMAKELRPKLDTKFSEILEIGENYDYYGSVLENKGVMIYERAYDENGGMISHPVHKDERGYYYLDLQGNRQVLSPTEMMRQGLKPETGKTVEDFPNDDQVKEAALRLQTEGRNLNKALNELADLQKQAEELKPPKNEEVLGGAENQTSAMLSNHNENYLLTAMYERSPFAPFTPEQAAMDEARYRLLASTGDKKTYTDAEFKEATKYLADNQAPQLQTQLADAGYIINDMGPGMPGKPKTMMASDTPVNEAGPATDDLLPLDDSTSRIRPRIPVASAMVAAADAVTYGEGASKLGVMGVTPEFNGASGVFNEDPLNNTLANRPKGNAYTA